jgi:hypothetical protein
MVLRAALGFKLHTGWAALVAVSGSPRHIQLHFRQRIELLPPDNSIPRFVYHVAAERPLVQAAEMVKRAREASTNAARLAVQEALREIASRGVTVDVCGVLSGSKPVPDDLAGILRSHPLIHAAEGALFQGAIASACEKAGMTIVLAGERQVWAQAGAALGVAEAGLRKEVDELRKTIGPPWSADHKAATAIALLALKSKEARATRIRAAP